MNATARRLRGQLYDALGPDWRSVGDLQKAGVGIHVTTMTKHLRFLAVSGQIETTRRRGVGGQEGNYYRRKQDG